jgi:hypothetical protein
VTTLGEYAIRVTADTDPLRRDLTHDLPDAGDRAGRETGRRFAGSMRTSVGAIAGTIGGLLTGAAVGTFLASAMADAREANRLNAQTAAVIKSTGNAAGVSADQVAGLADSLEKMTGQDGAAIQNGENLLLTFTNIKDQVGAGNDVFTQATKTMLDMSVALGQDTKSSALQLGKALNDPIAGVTALREVGVSFTAGQQAQITALVKTGKTMDAQKVILAELNKEFGGSATAQADPAMKAQAAWAAFREEIGQRLLPVMDTLATWGADHAGWLVPATIAVASFVGVLLTVAAVEKVLAFVTGAWSAAQAAYNVIQGLSNSLLFVWIGVHAIDLGAWIAKTAAIIGHNIAMAASLVWTNAVKVATLAWTGVQWLLNAALLANPIGIVILVIVALVAGVILAYKHSETFRKIVQGAWQGIQTAAKWAWENVLRPVFNFIGAYIRVMITAYLQLWQWVQIAWNFIVAAFRNAWAVVSVIFGWIAGVIRTQINAYVSLWHGVQSAWNFIVAAARSAWAWVAGVFGNFKAGLDRLAGYFAAAVSAIRQRWDQLKEAARAPVNFIIGTVINRGIIDTINTVTGLLGHNANIRHMPTFASGGIIPGRPSLTDNTIIGAATGEYVMPTDKTRKYLPLLEAMRGGHLEGFALGGIVGNVVRAVTGGIGTAISAITDPGKFIRDHVDLGSIGRNFGSSPFVQMAARIPEMLISRAVEWIKGKFSAPGPTGGGPVNLGTGGGSPTAILAMARRFYPGAQMSSGYRPGDPGYHGQNLAADIIGGGVAGMNRIAQGFYGISNRLIELIHSPSWFVKNGQRVGAGLYRSVFAEHFNHVHVAARTSALSFDNGGELPPGLTLAWNGTGRPEHVGAGGVTIAPGAVVVNVAGDGDGEKIARHVDAALRGLLVELKTGVRR